MFLVAEPEELWAGVGVCTRHGIAPVIDRDELTADGIRRSLEKLGMGKTRYREVLYAEGQD